MHPKLFGPNASHNYKMNCLNSSTILGFAHLKLKYFDTDNDRFNDPSNDDVIELLAPNRFVEDWVKSKFLKRIEELFHQLSGNGVVLGISASPANAPQYKQQAQYSGHNRKLMPWQKNFAVVNRSQN